MLQLSALHPQGAPQHVRFLLQLSALHRKGLRSMPVHVCCSFQLFTPQGAPQHFGSFRCRFPGARARPER